MKKSRRRGYTLIEFLVVLGIVAFLAALGAAILLPLYSHETGNARRANCQKNLKQLGLAFQQYTQDNDEQFMPVFVASKQFYGWADALQPYTYQNPLILQCPSEATAEAGKNPTQRGYTDYWMNAALSRVELKNLSEPSHTILSGDGNDGTDATNARYSLRALPQKWLKDEKSPAHRHLDLMNILFADGHVKAFRASGLVAGAPEYKHFGWRWRP